MDLKDYTHPPKLNFGLLATPEYQVYPYPINKS